MSEKLYCYKYPHPALTADTVIMAPYEDSLKILLIERKNEPYKGYWAFPGGFMNMDENAEECARRELEEETGLKNIVIEQLQAFTDVNRDPRERIITIAFYGFSELQYVKGADDALNAQWFDIHNLPELGFDHKSILETTINRLKEKIKSGSLTEDCFPETFTENIISKIITTISNL